MDLTPFLLASSIAKMIRSPFCPDIFSNLLPGNLGWLTHAHVSIGQRAVSVEAFCVNGDGLAEQSDLLKRHVRMDNSVKKEYSQLTSWSCHLGFRTRWSLDLVRVRYRPRSVDSASLNPPNRLISLYDRPRRLQSMRNVSRLLL